MPPCRVVFMGSPAFAVPSLAALLRNPDLCQVVGVVTQPDKPQGRGRKLAPCHVKAFAQEQSLACFSPTKLKAAQTHEELAALKADIFIVAAYGRILPKALLSMPALGCVNVHASLLPRHRGASPIAHALLLGDDVTGVCIMAMEEGLDTGPVYACRSLPIEAEDTCASLTDKLAVLGAEALIKTLPSIVARTAEPKVQTEAGATYAPLLKKEAGRIDWQQPARAVARQVRAFNPWPSAYTFGPSGRLAVLRARADESLSGTPGHVIVASAAGVAVACGEGALWLLEVKPAGRSHMRAQDWLAGRGIQMGQAFTASS